MTIVKIPEHGDLHDKTIEIYDVIVEHTELHGWAPSVREIGERVGLTSTSTVHHHLRRLERHGLIVRGPRQSRAISLGLGRDAA
jgi:repressor LexA